MDKVCKPRNLTIIAVAIAALLVIVGLFVLKIGVADNGSLQKTLEGMGLYDAQMSVGSGYYSDGFGVQGADTVFKTSNFAYDFGKLGVPANGVVPVAKPAAMYAVLFLAGLFFLLFSLMGDFKWNNILLAVLAVFMLADMGYIAFFNTPYEQGAEFCYLIAFAGLFVYTLKSQKIWSLILLGLAGFLFAGASGSAAWPGIVLGLFILRLSFLKKEVLWKILSVVMCVVTVFSGFFAILENQSHKDLYNSVFYGVLKDAAEPVAELQALGLPADFAQYAGIPSHEPQAQAFMQSPAFQSEFLDQIGYGKIVSYYLTHPQAAMKQLSAAANNGTFIKTAYLGNYAASSGKEPGGQAGFFALYSMVKSKIIPNQLIFILILLVVLAIGAFNYRKKYAQSLGQKILCEGIAVAALVTLLSLAVPPVLFGGAEIGFHMFLFNALFDLCLIAFIVGGTRLLWIRRENLKKTYGVNQ